MRKLQHRLVLLKSRCANRMLHPGYDLEIADEQTLDLEATLRL